MATKFQEQTSKQTNLHVVLQGVIDKWHLFSKAASRSTSSSQQESTLYFCTTKQSQKPNENFLPQPMDVDNDNNLITKPKFRLCWLKCLLELTSDSGFISVFKQKPQKSKEVLRLFSFDPTPSAS